MSANTAVYDRMTGWEMVEYFGRLHGIPPEVLGDRMETLFDRLKMNDTRDILGAKMSTGMKQKVSVARAVVHDPPVLIFDEATWLDVLVARAAGNGGRIAITASASFPAFMREAERLCDALPSSIGDRPAEGLMSCAASQQRSGVFFQLICNTTRQDRRGFRMRINLPV
jgi:sodium transport system ATP-binding protein